MQHKPATETDRRSESQTRRLRTWSRSPEGRGGVMGGRGRLCEGVSGGGSPPADFSIPAGGFSGGFFWRIFLGCTRRGSYSPKGRVSAF